MKIELYNDQEIWADIENYEGQYQASNFGNIKSINRSITQFGHKKNYVRMMSGKKIKPNTQNNGYLLVWLCKEGNTKALLIHRLVATAFIPNKLNLPQVNHKDGNKHNNFISNLEWCSRSDNVKHAYRVLGRKRNNKNETSN